MQAAENPRAVVGANNPPPPTAIELAAEPIEALRMFLAINPVILIEDEARDAKAVHDNVASALRRIEAERKGKVDPLNAEVKQINRTYHTLHNADGNRPGTWDKLLSELKSRMTTYAIQEERKRFEAEEAARQEAEEAKAKARAAAEAEAEAREAAAAGVCDVDLAEAVEAADTTSQEALRKMWTARRAEAQTTVRIKGGSGNAISLKDHETLRVTDWQAAISEMGLTKDIADAILKSARAYRKLTDALPTGVEATFERSL